MMTQRSFAVIIQSLSHSCLSLLSPLRSSEPGPRNQTACRKAQDVFTMSFALMFNMAAHNPTVLGPDIINRYVADDKIYCK